MGEPVYSPRQSADVAYAMGADGTPAPAWVKGDVSMYRAYKQGLDSRGGPAFHPPAGPPREPRRPRANGGGRAGQYAQRGFSPTAAYRRFGARHVDRVSSAGDSGGLFLALVLYPLFLATIKYGAAGPGLWFRAKWLNNGAGPDAATSAGTKPLAPNAPDGKGRQKITGATRPAGGVGRSAA